MAKTGSAAGEPKIPRGPGRPPTGGISMYEADRRIKIQKARALKMANDRARGLLIPAEASHRELFNAMRVVRENVLNVPARIGAEVAAESDPTVVIRRLEGELRLALGDAADTLEADAS